MSKNPKKYFLKVTNPQKGTYVFMCDIIDEFLLKKEEHWEKIDDPDIQLFTKPVYSRHFNHIVKMWSINKPDIEFIKYIFNEYIKQVEKLEHIYVEL